MSDVPSEKTTKEDAENKGKKSNENKNDALLNAYKVKYAGIDLEKASEVLQKYFPFLEMKKEQKECLYGLKNFQHVLNIMPTGGGKSLVYQLVPLLIKGISIVISPLISLIQDQVASLNKKHINAVSIHSSISKKENENILNRLKEETMVEIKVLYVTPETATKDPLLSIIKTLYRKNKISLIAIDEAHCISTWGCQFRKSYRNLNVILSSCPFVRVYACTATATKRVERDIVTNLGIGTTNGAGLSGEKDDIVTREKDCLRIVRCSFNRPNLKYIIFYTDRIKEEERKKNVYNIIIDKKNEGKTGIVYCFKRETCEMISKYLRSKGIQSLSYHAGLSATARKKAQEKWINGQATVLVATIAFGMGIDRQNVSYIIHYNLPKSLENYYQESGRAGRNGNVAFCYLFFSTDEVSKLAFIIKSSYSDYGGYGTEKSENCEKELHNLECVNNMCLTDECIRAQILRHFGEIYNPSKKKNGEQEIDIYNQMEQCDENYCCSFCEDPYGTRNKIKNCKQKLYSQMDDYESDNSYCDLNVYYDDPHENEYGEDSEGDSSCLHKKKKIIYEVPSIYQKKKTKYDPLYCNNNTASDANLSGFQRMNNSFSNVNERVLHKKIERMKPQVDTDEINKQNYFIKSKGELNGNSKLNKRTWETQFKSASTIIPVDIREEKPSARGMCQLEKNGKQNDLTNKYIKHSERLNLHPSKKIKKLDMTAEFVPPRNLHDLK